MTSSLNEMVTAIAPTIPSALIAPQNLAAIGSVAQHFPMTLSTTVGFECPLSMAADADFFLRVSGAWGQSILSGVSHPPPILKQLCLESEVFPPSFDNLWNDPTWRRIRQFAHRWADPASLLHKAVEDIWLEFDIAPDGQSFPSPSSFFGITSPGLTSFAWISHTALPLLLGEPIKASAERTLQQCFASIPTSARLFQVGVLTSRAHAADVSPAIRLYIQNMQLPQLKSTLSRLSWTGDVELLAQLITRVCQGKGHFSLQLEIQDALSPVIAVECYFQNRSEWRQVLNRLVITGFCSPERAQALLAYPGYVRAQDQLAPFPKLLENWSTQLSPYRECLLVKRLAYLKFTYQPGQPLLAKAYLGLSPTWIDARYLTPGNTGAEKSPDQKNLAIALCRDLIQQLDYSEIDVDAEFPCQRSQKSQWLNKALEIMTVGG